MNWHDGSFFESVGVGLTRVAVSAVSADVGLAAGCNITPDRQMSETDYSTSIPLSLDCSQLRQPGGWCD
jgi:hypothetical protein